MFLLWPMQLIHTFADVCSWKCFEWMNFNTNLYFVKITFYVKMMHLQMKIVSLPDPNTWWHIYLHNLQKKNFIFYCFIKYWNHIRDSSCIGRYAYLLWLIRQDISCKLIHGNAMTAQRIFCEMQIHKHIHFLNYFRLLKLKNALPRKR